jgi:hypothetical protein
MQRQAAEKDPKAEALNLHDADSYHSGERESNLISSAATIASRTHPLACAYVNEAVFVALPAWAKTH